MTTNTFNLTIHAVHEIYKLTGSRTKTGKLIGVSGPTVIRKLKAAGLAINQPGRPSEQLSPGNLLNAYWIRGESLRTIASHAKVSHSKVRTEMIRWGIPTR